MELVHEPVVIEAEPTRAPAAPVDIAPADDRPPPPDYEEPPAYAQEPGPTGEEYFDNAAPEPAAAPPAPPSLSGKRYLMPPARKAIGLLLANPALAAEEPPEFWLEHSEPELRSLGQLLKLLRERPHYQLPHIIGHWRGVYGAKEAEQLAAIAGQDLLVAAGAHGANRAIKPSRADYDTRVAFCDCLKGIQRQLAERQKTEALSQLRQKSSDFAGLSREEREALVKAALAHKTPH